MNNFLEKWQKALCEDFYEPEKPVWDFKNYDDLIGYVPNTAKNVLEIGAGDGYIVRKLREKGINAIGTTICKKDVEAYGLIYQDMHDLQWIDETFDVIIAKGVLEHALSPRLVIRETYRVLRKEGLFFVEVPINYEGIEMGNRAHFYCFTPKQWGSLLMLNGFSINKTEYSGSLYRIISQKNEKNYQS